MHDHMCHNWGLNLHHLSLTHLIAPSRTVLLHRFTYSLFLHKNSHEKSVCLTMVVSKAVVDPFHCPLGKSHFPSFLQGGCVLIGLEFRVIVWELVEEDGYGQTVEDDSKRDADESEKTTQYGLRVDVSVAHSGDADLQGERRAVSSVDLCWPMWSFCTFTTRVAFCLY